VQSAFLNAPILNIHDILHDREERQSFKTNLIFTILRIIVRHGGEGFKKFEKDVEKNQPETSEKIKVHTTKLHPLPAWNIDESTITGNAEVVAEINKELRLSEVPGSQERVRFLAGDQMSIARLRALEGIRAGHESGENGFFWGAWIPGLFHAKIADIHGTLLAHFGKPDTGTQNPGSLWFHNSRLDRLPITLTSLPPFRTSRDLVFISLYARICHCLLLVSGCASLEDYLNKFTKWDDLFAHANQIYESYASASKVHELRQKRKEHLSQSGSRKPTEGDMVFENAALFLRDALISREFTDAIKAGDSGRVVLVLKIWAMSFRGNGRTKYAYETLNLIHLLSNVWPKPIR
jgi:hypothetical protein